MNIMQIVGIGISGALISVILKEYKPVYAMCVGIVTAGVIFYFLLSEIYYIFQVVQTISDRLSIDSDYISIVIRLIGLAYVSRFGSDLCRDAGQNAIAQKIELAGKIMLVATSIPIITAVLNLLTGILP